MTIDRRKFLLSGAAVGAAALGAPAIAQPRAKVKLGYLHTLAVDGQIWTGIDRGNFARHGVEFEPVQFTTGLELFQAMIGGSIDMLATGAVISNFPARGQGKIGVLKGCVVDARVDRERRERSLAVLTLDVAGDCECAGRTQLLKVARVDRRNE